MGRGMEKGVGSDGETERRKGRDGKTGRGSERVGSDALREAEV